MICLDTYHVTASVVSPSNSQFGLFPLNVMCCKTSCRIYYSCVLEWYIYYNNYALYVTE